MAFSDYHACDKCGNRKTFYDADMSGIEWVGDHYRYSYYERGNGESPYPGYRVYALCHECEKTHQIVIVPKDAETGA